MDNLEDAFKQADTYYIHYNNINIGSRAKNATLNFAQQRKNINTNLQDQYKDYFRSNVSNESLEILDKALELNETQFFENINKHLTEKLQKELNVNKLQELHSLVEKSDISDHLKAAFSKKGSSERLEELGSALNAIGEAIKLLDGDQGALGALLITAVKSSKNQFSKNIGFKAGIKKIGKRLQILLKEYENNNNFKKVQPQLLTRLERRLENLAFVLKTGTFKSSGKNLDAKGLSRSLLNGIVSTQIAQGFSIMVDNKANNFLDEKMAELVGDKTVKVTSPTGKNKRITGKADGKFSNVSLDLSAVDKKYSGSIEFNLGISSKFYTGEKFNNLTSNSFQGTFSSGSGGTLQQAIISIWGDDISRYLAYNYIVHNEKVEEMNDIIVARQLIRLFASAGAASDFASFMLVNGQVVSIWSLVSYVLTNNLLLSRSMGGGEKQAIVLSIPDRPKISKSNKWEESKESSQIDSWQRSRKVNSVINSAKIYAELHLNKLIQAVQKS